MTHGPIDGFDDVDPLCLAGPPAISNGRDRRSNAAGGSDPNCQKPEKDR